MNILEKLKRGILSTSPEQTREIATQLAALLPESCTLALSGDLGTGKTTFVQGLGICWGIRETITSPTYNLYTVYTGDRQLVHFDAYRLENAWQADDLLIEEFLVPPYCLAVEWPEKVAAWLPPPVWRLQFHLTGEEQHTIRLLSM